MTIIFDFRLPIITGAAAAPTSFRLPPPESLIFDGGVKMRFLMTGGRHRPLPTLHFVEPCCRMHVRPHHDYSLAGVLACHHRHLPGKV